MSLESLPTPLRRKYKTGDHVSIEDLREARQTVARAVQMDPRYLPIFQRLDRELQARDTDDMTLQRALSVAAAASPEPRAFV